MSNLFESLIARPLAEKMRPTRLELLVGQEHLLAPDAPLGRMLRERRASSMILWGPPGSGKTTLAKIIAEHVNMKKWVTKWGRLPQEDSETFVKPIFGTNVPTRIKMHC